MMRYVMRKALKNWFKTLVVETQTETNNKIDALEKTVNHLNSRIVDLKTEQKNSQELINMLLVSIEELLSSLDPNRTEEEVDPEITSLDSEQSEVIDYTKRYLN